MILKSKLKRLCKTFRLLSIMLVASVLLISCTSEPKDSDVFSTGNIKITGIQNEYTPKLDIRYMLADINYANDNAWTTADRINPDNAESSSVSAIIQSKNFINIMIPLFLQWDNRWGNFSYGESGTIASSGCGPTSFAMVLAGLSKNRNVNPKMIADWSWTNGHRVEGLGSAWSLFADGADYFGIKCTEIGINQNEILQSLQAGKPIIASMTAGHFTNDGHFIVLRGIAPNGGILVNDPNSLNNSRMVWDIRLII